MDALAKDRSLTKAEKRLPVEVKRPRSGKPIRMRRSRPPPSLPGATRLRQRPWLVARSRSLSPSPSSPPSCGGCMPASTNPPTMPSSMPARCRSARRWPARSATLDVTDNQAVKAGAVMAQLDDSIYQAQLGQAKAQVAQAEANIANLDAQLDAQRSRIDQANKQVTEAQAALAFSQQENTRYQDLLKTGSGTEQRAQQASSDLHAKAGGARQRRSQRHHRAEAAQGAADPARRRRCPARGGPRRPALRPRPTWPTPPSRAPVDGRVTKLSANKGTYLQPGQSMMMFVPR